MPFISVRMISDTLVNEVATIEREDTTCGLGKRGKFDESGRDCRGAVERESERVLGSLSGGFRDWNQDRFSM